MALAVVSSAETTTSAVVGPLTSSPTLATSVVSTTADTTATPTAAATATTTAATAVTSSADVQQSNERAVDGNDDVLAIAVGAAAGGVVLILLAVGLVVLLLRRQRRGPSPRAEPPQPSGRAADTEMTSARYDAEYDSVPAIVADGYSTLSVTHSNSTAGGTGSAIYGDVQLSDGAPGGLTGDYDVMPNVVANDATNYEGMPIT